MMRIDLQAQSSIPFFQSRTDNIPVSVTIKPSNNVPGTFEYQTNSRSLLRLLRLNTDLSGCVLDNFRKDLEVSSKGRLPAVKLRVQFLREIGYFVD